MNILILDYLFPKGHKTLNNNIIECLSTLGNVKVIAEYDYYSEYKKNWLGVELEEISVWLDGKNMLSRKLQSLITMVKTRKEVNCQKHNYIIALTFDTVAFAIGRLFQKFDNFLIVHHKNIDELNSSLKRFFFKTYMNKVHHVVFEDYFREYLINEIGVNEKRVHVIPHPISHSSLANTKEILYHCVGLSNSNDETFIKRIIEEEKNYSFLKNTDLHVVLRSKNYQFDNGNLKVISGFLPKEDYDNYIKKCICVFVPLPDTYKYRLSGAIYDAFSNYKVVIANNVPLVKQYQTNYPKICIGVNDVKTFFSKLVELKYSEVFEKEFEEFINSHDKAIVSYKFLDTFKKMSTTN